MKKAILFDLDGTLIHSLPEIAAAANRMLRERGYPEKPEDEYRYLVGRGARLLVSEALPQNAAANPLLFEEALSAYIQYYDQTLADSQPYEGISDMLDELKRAGYLLAVASNKRDQMSKRLVQTAFGARFDRVEGEQPGIPAKPDPALSLLILSELGVTRENCVFIGDTSVDMETAINGGLYPLGVAWGFRPWELAVAGAKRVVDHPWEVLGIVAEILG